MAPVRDLETLRRSVLRRLSLRRPKFSEFLSGDSFKICCNFFFDGKTLQINRMNKDFITDNFRNFIFCDLGKLSNFIDLLLMDKIIIEPGSCLVLHNGDHFPNKFSAEILLHYFQKIYSVNFLDENPRIIPIPLGIENQSLYRNGVTVDYSSVRNLGLPKFEDREIELLVCFNSRTNIVERFEALEICSSIHGVTFVKETVTPKKYRSLLLSSKYVLSPPGNGFDCHRTWEALYLGAIPIVKSAYWAFHNYEVPVLAIDRWADLKNLNFNVNRFPDKYELKVASDWLSL